jgi:ribosomal protein S27E
MPNDAAPASPNPPQPPVASAVLYRRHKPEETALYRVIEDHLPAFETRLSTAERPLPGFVLEEFRDYLRCGRLEHGFVRVKCDGCRHELLVAFSCKRRGFCPSCGARRMVETSAHLLDHVIPQVPVRQWVLSFPWPLRLLFASRPEALSRCLDVIVRAIETHLIHQAGLTRASGARTGIVTLVQRFGSALNLNIHLHMIVLDGVYTTQDGGDVRFHHVFTPEHEQMEKVLERLIARIVRRLTRDGWLIADPDYPWLDLAPQDGLDSLDAASTRYRIALGPAAGQRMLTLRSHSLLRADPLPKPFTVERNGFSLNAAVACQPDQRERLERLCRYVTRPAICLERLSVDAAGRVIVELAHPFRDGTTHIVFDPEDFMARLAALVPRPRANLTRYHGVFAPNCKLRHLIVPRSSGERSNTHRDATQRCDDDVRNDPTAAANTDTTPTAPLTWAQRLQRVFAIDITHCPHCGGRLRVIADVTDPQLIERILAHLRAKPPPRAAPARAARVPSDNDLRSDA